MSYWKHKLLLGSLMLGASSLNAVNLQEDMWRSAYENMLRGHPLGARNALVRLKEYNRFRLVALPPELESVLDRAIAQLPAVAITTAPAIEAEEPAAVFPVKKTKRKSSARSNPATEQTVVIDTRRVERDLLTKAENAYRAGRLEESQRLFRLALKVNPESDHAKAGLEKIDAEMK